MADQSSETTTAPVDPISPESISSPAIPEAPIIPTNTVQSPEEFHKRYVALVDEVGHTFNVEPVFVDNHDGTFAIALRQSIVPFKKA